MRAASTLFVLTVLAMAVSAEISVPQECPVPVLEWDKNTVITAPIITVDGVDYPFRYETLLRSAERPSLEDKYPFGLLVDQAGEPIFKVGEDGNPERIINEATGVVVGNYELSPSVDYVSFLPMAGKVYSVAHFEESIGAHYMLEIEQGADCRLHAVSTKPLNWSAWGGIYSPCAGSITPWNTHYGSEEGDPDARAFADAKELSDIDEDFLDVLRYFGVYPNQTTLEVARTVLNPYRYGWPTEITVSEDGSYTVQKHFAQGRMSYELPYVLPDEQTVFQSDDAGNGGLQMFKADAPRDFTCGELFAAKFNQTALGENGGANFTLEWISLGSACQDEVEAYVNELTFYDMWNATEPLDDGTCPAPYKVVISDAGYECLLLQAGMEKAASRLETRRYAGYMGATLELTKSEGVTYAPYHGDNGRMYLSISRIEEGMEDFAAEGEASSEYDYAEYNHVRIPWNSCGCVFGLDLDESFMPTNMWPLVCGNKDENTDEFNACNLESIAAPDNVAMLAGHNALLIDEDTDDHENDFLWLYDFASQSLTRLHSSPVDAEVTSAYWHPNINGCAYIIDAVQAPGSPITGEAAWLGYFTFPSTQWDLARNTTAWNINAIGYEERRQGITVGDAGDYVVETQSLGRKLLSN